MVAQGRTPGWAFLGDTICCCVCWDNTATPPPFPGQLCLSVLAAGDGPWGPLRLDGGRSATTPCSLWLKSWYPFLEELQRGVGWKY